VDRYGALGRSVLRMIATLDGSAREPARGEKSYLTVGGMVLPAWALKLLAVTLILPALIASIDALARASRRREPVARSFVWLGAAVVPLVAGLLVAWLMSLVGLIDDAAPAPPDPRAVNLNGTALSGLIATSFTAALVWIFMRTLGLRRGEVAAAPSAGCAVSLVMAAVAMPIAVLNPFAALVLVPAVHLWMLATLTEVRVRPSLVMVAIGLVPVLAVIAYLLWRLGLSPPAGAYYVLLLVTGNQTGLLTTLACVVLLAVTLSVCAILIAQVRRGEPDAGRRDGPPEPPRPRIFGPGGHAGPGMLGGTQSGAGRR
jgi:hypothetical protein